MLPKNIYDKSEAFFIIYWKWKELNQLIKQYYTRWVNLHEVITENLCCILNWYVLHASEGWSEDAITNDWKKVQIKWTSNFDDDLTSFGPKSEFDVLEFFRLDQTNDIFYCYRIPIEELENIKVNKANTFKQQQLTGKRPRFSIIKSILHKQNYIEYATINMKTWDVVETKNN